jgi:acyl-coenzyme A thioesterase PaaI-like protein
MRCRHGLGLLVDHRQDRAGRHVGAAFAEPQLDRTGDLRRVLGEEMNHLGVLRGGAAFAVCPMVASVA